MATPVSHWTAAATRLGPGNGALTRVRARYPRPKSGMKHGALTARRHRGSVVDQRFPRPTRIKAEVAAVVGHRRTAAKGGCASWSPTRRSQLRQAIPPTGGRPFLRRPFPLFDARATIRTSLRMPPLTNGDRAGVAYEAVAHASGRRACPALDVGQRIRRRSAPDLHRATPSTTPGRRSRRSVTSDHRGWLLEERHASRRHHHAALEGARQRTWGADRRLPA
jgi:hypothetical protein